MTDLESLRASYREIADRQALINDHIAGRHARVGVIECPVCAKLNEQAAECQHPIGCEHDR